MTPNVAICIHDGRLRSLFSLLLVEANSHVLSCSDDEALMAALSGTSCQLCVLDHALDAELPKLIVKLRRQFPDTRLLLLANREDADGVFPLFSKGLTDALLKPINPKRALVAIGRLITGGDGDAAASFVSGADSQDTDYSVRYLVARSNVMKNMIRKLWAVRNDPVGLVLTGESGVEFELVAREYVVMSGDSRVGLHILDGPDISRESLDELLIINNLNTTGPLTFFLPNVDQCDRRQRKNLLEFLMDFRRRKDALRSARFIIGLVKPESDSEQGAFLEEILFSIPKMITIPSLKQRGEDLELLIQDILFKLVAIDFSIKPRKFHPMAMQILKDKLWPGNYIELSAVIRNTVRRSLGREILPGDLGDVESVKLAAIKVESSSESESSIATVQSTFARKFILPPVKA